MNTIIILTVITVIVIIMIIKIMIITMAILIINKNINNGYVHFCNSLIFVILSYDT